MIIDPKDLQREPFDISMFDIPALSMTHNVYLPTYCNTLSRATGQRSSSTCCLAGQTES